MVVDKSVVDFVVDTVEHEEDALKKKISVKR
jgi:hypothetical protein